MHVFDIVIAVLIVGTWNGYLIYRMNKEDKK